MLRCREQDWACSWVMAFVMYSWLWMRYWQTLHLPAWPISAIADCFMYQAALLYKHVEVCIGCCLPQQVFIDVFESLHWYPYVYCFLTGIIFAAAFYLQGCICCTSMLKCVEVGCCLTRIHFPAATVWTSAAYTLNRHYCYWIAALCLNS